MNHFVAYGRINLLMAPETQKQLEESGKRIFEKYQLQLDEAGFFTRMLIRWEVHQEVIAEIERIAPSHALY